MAAVGVMHLLGGLLNLGGTRLYDIYFIEGFFKYDNLMHTAMALVATIIGYNMLKPHLDHKTKHNKFVLSLILIAIAMGLGAFIEILEFTTVIFLGAAETVGGYFNNAIDLVFNLIGAIGALLFINPPL
jgi:uncharacterized membrane protein YjdF